MTIRRAEVADTEAMAHIQELAPEAAQWRAAEYLAHLAYVAEQAGELTGMLVLLDAAGEYEILTLAVHPAWRRRGVARQLLSTARAAHPGRYFLEVRESNRVARQFYESMGFAEIGKRPAYYAGPTESAIVMQLQQ